MTATLLMLSWCGSRRPWPPPPPTIWSSAATTPCTRCVWVCLFCAVLSRSHASALFQICEHGPTSLLIAMLKVCMRCGKGLGKGGGRREGERERRVSCAAIPHPAILHRSRCWRSTTPPATGPATTTAPSSCSTTLVDGHVFRLCSSTHTAARCCRAWTTTALAPPTAATRPPPTRTRCPRYVCLLLRAKGRCLSPFSKHPPHKPAGLAQVPLV